MQNFHKTIPTVKDIKNFLSRRSCGVSSNRHIKVQEWLTLLQLLVKSNQDKCWGCTQTFDCYLSQQLFIKTFPSFELPARLTSIASKENKCLLSIGLYPLACHSQGWGPSPYGTKINKIRPIQSFKSRGKTWLKICQKFSLSTKFLKFLVFQMNFKVFRTFNPAIVLYSFGLGGYLIHILMLFTSVLVYAFQ